MSKQTVGGVQYVPQIAVQYVYLDFDGELTDYNGEILTIEGVEVSDPQLTQARIADILAELNKKYASQNVILLLKSRKLPNTPPFLSAKPKPLTNTAALPD